MTVYALRVASAAAYLGYGYRIYRDLYGPLYDKTKIITQGPIKDFVSQKAQAMGLTKELMVVEGCCMRLGSMGVQVHKGMMLTDPEERFNYIHLIAHVKINTFERWSYLVPLVAAIFTTVLLNAKSPHWACIAGLVAGFATYLGVHWQCEKFANLEAFKHCTKEEIQTGLDHLIEAQGDHFRHWLNHTWDGPIWYQIHYFEKYLQTLKD